MKQIAVLKTLLLLFLGSLCMQQAHATHIRGGYITFTADDQNPRKHNFKFFLYRNVESHAFDTEVRIYMGDGAYVDVPISANNYVCNMTDESTFEWEYTFPADGFYIISYNSMNRNAGIINMSQPSDQLSMAIYTTVHVNSLRGLASGILLNSPSSATAYVGTPFKYNLLAHNTDGDSLAYSLVTPLYLDSDAGTLKDIPGYYIPDGFSINQLGEINWTNPAMKGEYNFAVEIKKYRRGTQTLLSSFINEIQIRVIDPVSEPQVVLVNQERLARTEEGYIIGKPGSNLKLTYFIEGMSGGNLRAIDKASELLAPHLQDKYTLQVAERDSANGKVQELVFNFPPEMQRSKPYALGIKGTADISAHQCSSYGQLYNYILLSNGTVTTVPDPVAEGNRKLYPNPARQHFTIEAPDVTGAILTLSSADGRIIYRAQLKPGKNSITRPAYLKAGLYTYTVATPGQQTQRGKLLLQ